MANFKRFQNSGDDSTLGYINVNGEKKVAILVGRNLEDGTLDVAYLYQPQFGDSGHVYLVGLSDKDFKIKSCRQDMILSIKRQFSAPDDLREVVFPIINNGARFDKEDWMILSIESIDNPYKMKLVILHKSGLITSVYWDEFVNTKDPTEWVYPNLP